MSETMEQTNPVEELDIDFDDEEIEEDEEATEPETEIEDGDVELEGATDTEESKGPERKTNEQEEMFPEELVVYGEKKQVTMSEAKDLVQKGLAYDIAQGKWENKLKTANEDPRLAFVDELAKNAGVDTATFMANTRMRAEYAELIDEYGSLDAIPDAVKKMFTENAEANKKKAAEEFNARKQAQEDERKKEEFWNFVEKHPDVDTANLPEEVKSLVVGGESLEGAYAIFEAKQLKEEKAQLENELKILKQNNKNKKSSLPTSQSKGVAREDDDLEWEFGE